MRPFLLGLGVILSGVAGPLPAQLKNPDLKSPFEDPKFDPNKSPIAEMELVPGKSQRFTMFVPYPAGKGGLRVRLRMEGADAALLKVFLGEDVAERELAVNGGAFDLLIPEGDKQFRYWLLWDGASANGSPVWFTSTILDEMGIPTHITRLAIKVRLASARN